MPRRTFRAAAGRCHAHPDPAYTALRAALAALHGVTPGRIVVAGSASEFIHRITTWARLHGCTQVQLPPHSYGDYAQAAQAHGLAVLRRSATRLRWWGMH